MTTLADLPARRAAFQRTLHDALLADDRVIAAWLTGSDGRDDADEWSDFDLGVAVSDESLELLAARDSPLLHSVGNPLLTQAGFVSDSIPNGRFWLTVYAGAISVDWNIGPISSATRPAASVLLFERQPVPPTPETPAPGASLLRDRAQTGVEFFWAMAPIAVKYAGRGHTRLAIEQAHLLRRSYERLWLALHNPAVLFDEIEHNRPLPAELDRTMPRFGTTITVAGALVVIGQFCDRVEALHPALERLGVAIPAAMPSEVRELAAVARQAAQRGGTRPNRGLRR